MRLPVQDEVIYSYCYDQSLVRKGLVKMVSQLELILEDFFMIKMTLVNDNYTNS